MSGLDRPDGDSWAIRTLDEVCEINPRHDDVPPDMPVTFVPMSAIDEEKGTISNPEIRQYEEVCTGYMQFEEDDVLFAKITPCMENGKAAIARGLKNGLGCGSTEFFVLRPKQDVLPKYIYYFLRQEWFRNAAQQQMTGTSGHQRVPKKFIKNAEIPLPPLPTQRRIAARLDALTARANRARDHLEAIPPLVEKFKKSLLARAYTGELTADWREQNPDVEPAAELLERIRAERKQKWIHNYAANLADRARKRAEKKGEPFDEEDWQAYYDKKLPQGEDRYEEPEPVDPDNEDLPEIPETWEWVTVDAIAATVQYGISEKMNKEGPGVPILRMPNIESGRLVFDDLKYLPHDHEKFPDMYLEPGDVLFNRTNSAELVGKTAVYHEGDLSPCTFASYLIRVKPIGLEPDLLAYFINSPYGDEWIASARSQQVGQANVSGSKLKAFRVPLPPASEQKVLHSGVQRQVTKIEDLTGKRGENLDQMEKLREATLNQALMGTR